MSMTSTLGSLPSEFAFDTETDRYEDGHIRTCLIQVCSLGASSLDDVRVLEGWDCYERFFDLFDECLHDVDCRMFNLGGYEFDWFKDLLSERYEFTRSRRPAKGCWSCVADNHSVYSVKIVNQHGKMMRISDDLKRVGGNRSMKSTAEAVRRSRPDWFPDGMEVKEETEYNNGWYTERDTFPERYERFMHYSKQDAYSQAMISRWLKEFGVGGNLTASSAGLDMALALKYRGVKASELDGKEKRYTRMDFEKKYPPLDREMQDIVEESLLGGFVWGGTGTWHGTFTHVDYSSSYPYEYAFGNMFSGTVQRLIAGQCRKSTWNRVLSGDYMRWMLVSFDFSLAGGMPAISGRECRTSENPMIGSANKKMKTGHVTRRLYTESYLNELKMHYTLTNIEVHEVWFAKRAVGEFRVFIEKCYSEKSRPELKGTMEREMWKLFMNGGIHGKTITKTHRKERVFEGGDHLEAVVNEPELCSLIGFTGMMNGRERLLRHCRRVLEAGHRVLMCDTDSMVTDCTEAEIKEIIGDWFAHESGSMEHSLGRFEIETDKDGNTEFDEFKCWGLKRYLELNHGEYRKSAFASMHDDLQEKLLPQWETDGTMYAWEQTGKVKDKYGKIVTMVTKHAKAENVWYEEKTLPKETGGSAAFDRVLKESRARLRSIQDETVRKEE